MTPELVSDQMQERVNAASIAAREAAKAVLQAYVDELLPDDPVTALSVVGGLEQSALVQAYVEASSETMHTMALIEFQYCMAERLKLIREGIAAYCDERRG